MYVMNCVYQFITFPLAAGAVFGNPKGNVRQKVVLHNFTQAQVLNTERKTSTQEQLAVSLLQLLFTTEELSKGNCTKPVREDILQLDSERLWAIKCKFCV